MVVCSLIRFCFDDTGFWQFHDPFAQQVFIEHTVCARHCLKHWGSGSEEDREGVLPSHSSEGDRQRGNSCSSPE